MLLSVIDNLEGKASVKEAIEKLGCQIPVGEAVLELVEKVPCFRAAWAIEGGMSRTDNPRMVQPLTKGNLGNLKPTKATSTEVS